jgi:hypothetical protein
LWGDAEYSHYVELCYPVPADRQAIFMALSRNAQPHMGYKLLGLLLEVGKVKWVWTTNFDDLVDRGRPANRCRPLLQIGMDCPDRLDRIRREGDESVQIFLHGDYRYDHLRNTASELQSLDVSCLEKLKELCHQLPLVVVGYSGRDGSVMQCLAEAYSQNGQGGLYWACMSGSEPVAPVRELLDRATQAGNRAELVHFGGFDDLMARLARFWLRDTQHREPAEDLLSMRPTVSAFTLDNLAADGDWVLGNAYPVNLPNQLYQFSMKRIAEPGAWKRLKEIIKGRPIIAGLLRRKALALGRVAAIQEALGDGLDSRIEQITLADADLTIADGIIRQIMLSGLVAALAARNLERIGRYSLRSLEEVVHVYKGARYRYSPSVDLSLDFIDGQVYCLTQPDVYIHPTSEEARPSKDELKAVKRDILWRQRNFHYMAAVKNWRQILFAGPGWRVVYPPGAETGFEFAVSKDSPTCARCYSASPGPTDFQMAREFARFEKFKAFAVGEPCLRFAMQSRQGKPVKHLHPIQGLMDCGGPLESYQDALHVGRDIRLGVVCLQGHEILLGNFLNSLNQPAPVGQYDDADYVVAFPGFAEAFKCGLLVPTPRDGVSWKSVRDIQDGDPVSANRRATEAVTNCIREMECAGQVDVVLVYIPTKWSAFEHILDENVHLDLHDQIKAFCVEKHLRSQLLRESKVRSERTARIRWWLSLALFTKSLRVPWMLDACGERVAYAGIGFAVDEACPEERIVTGCCHLFNAAGIGMKFRLGELRNPIWRWEPVTRRRNPFMSREDAYQMGVRTRQLFFESHQDAPDRVMVCKRTPFVEPEVEGMLSALSGVKHVDLLSIESEDAWRFCAYDPNRKQAHGFPVRRGTGVVLDCRSILLWLHGNVVGLKGDHISYFQGKSRIPGPVRVTRFSGDSPVETLAYDLTALTKMDWNTFALYKKLPVTVTTPGTIARIARLLRRLPAESYDYRLFM